MQPQGLGGSAGCLVPPQPRVSPQPCSSKLLRRADTSSVILDAASLGKAFHLPSATSHLREPRLRLQDVLLHLVGVRLHAGDEHGQIICGGPEGGSSKADGGRGQISPPFITAQGLITAV